VENKDITINDLVVMFKKDFDDVDERFNQIDNGLSTI